MGKESKYGPIPTHYIVGETLGMPAIAGTILSFSFTHQGKGSFSVVKRVKHKATLKDYALKIIDKSVAGAEAQSMIQAEVRGESFRLWSNI